MAKSTAKKVGQTPDESVVQTFKRRMLDWPNPVEYVNNMYGCHPADNSGDDYFQVVFAPPSAL